MKTKLRIKLYPYLVVAFVALLLIGINWDYFACQREPSYSYKPYVSPVVTIEMLKACVKADHVQNSLYARERMEHFTKEHEASINEVNTLKYNYFGK